MSGINLHELRSIVRITYKVPSLYIESWHTLSFRRVRDYTRMTWILSIPMDDNSPSPRLIVLVIRRLRRISV